MCVCGIICLQSYLQNLSLYAHNFVCRIWHAGSRSYILERELIFWNVHNIVHTRSWSRITSCLEVLVKTCLEIFIFTDTRSINCLSRPRVLRSAALHLSLSGFLSDVRIDYCLVEVRKASLEVDWMCFLGRIVVFKIRFHPSKHLSSLSHVLGRDYAGWDYIHNTSVLGEMCEKKSRFYNTTLV